MLKDNGTNVVIYEPTLKDNTFEGIEVVHDLKLFKDISDVIIANILDIELDNVKNVSIQEIYSVETNIEPSTDRAWLL